MPEPLRVKGKVAAIHDVEGGAYLVLAVELGKDDPLAVQAKTFALGQLVSVAVEAA